MTYQMPQHSASNSRNPSDLYLIPDHYDFLGEVDSEIKLMTDMDEKDWRFVDDCVMASYEEITEELYGDEES